MTSTPALAITALDPYTLFSYCTCTRNSFTVNIFFRLLTLWLSPDRMKIPQASHLLQNTTYSSTFVYLLPCFPNEIIPRYFHSLEQGCPSPLRLTTRECLEATWTRHTRPRATTTAWGPSGAAASEERRKMWSYNPWTAYTAPKI